MVQPEMVGPFLFMTFSSQCLPSRHVGEDFDFRISYYPSGFGLGRHMRRIMMEDRSHEYETLRLAQLPTARATRTKVLPRSHPLIQPAARQLNSKRIRCGAPPPSQGMGGTTSHRRNTHLRQMRTTSHSHRPMGPRPHRQQTKLDRTRASQLQQERRSTQSNRKR